MTPLWFYNSCQNGPSSISTAYSWTATIAGETEAGLTWEHDPAPFHCPYWSSLAPLQTYRHLCCEFNGNLLIRWHECRPLVSNRWEMVLLDMRTLLVSWTCCRMKVDVACVFATDHQQMRRSMYADIIISALVPLKLTTFSHSNHLHHSGALWMGRGVSQMRFAVWTNVPFSVQFPCPS